MVCLGRHLPHALGLWASRFSDHLQTHHTAASSLQLPATASLSAQSLLTSSHASSTWDPAHYMDLILHSSKHTFWQGRPQQTASFLESSRFFNWVLLAVILEVFVCMHIFILLKFPPKKNCPGPGLMLLLWAGAAIAFNAVICWQDKQEGLMWNAGYFLELMSLMENVFVFHVIIQSFRVPRLLVRKALFVVTCLQIIFQAVLFLGFADILRRLHIQYILGVWLVICAYLAIQSGKKNLQEDMLFKDWYAYRLIQMLFGHTLSESYEGDSCFFLDKAARHYRCSLLLPVILFLGIAGLSLEIDGILLKIEELDSKFMSFSSSAIASLIMPEVFLLAEDLFCQFRSLKYVIAFALAFFGAQLLLHQFIVIPTILSCAIVFAALLLCILISLLWSERPENEEQV